MPIYEYHCQNCGKTLELLLDIDAQGPQICGFRCALTRGEQDDLRGFGSLQRQLSSFSQVSEMVGKDRPSAEDAAKVGLSTYKNEGNGTFTKIAGRDGPDTLQR